MQIDNMANTQIEKLQQSVLGKVGIILALVGAIASLFGFFIDKGLFFSAYLIAYMFWLSIALGGLFFTMLHHIVGADWSIVIRRIAENLMMTLPYMAILFLPIAFVGLHDLYHWTHADVVASDPILQHKSGWLNEPFFIIRSVLYLLCWNALAFSLYHVSKKQDNGGTAAHTALMKRISAPGILIFALSVTFAGWDWVMSLDPHWFSTMFGVYTFASVWWITLAFITLIIKHIRKKANLEATITVEHFHDIGKLMFGFTVFWAYIAFSQFMLIWYANIPEETVWFRHRWEHGWETVSILLILGHFVLPFLVLLFRSSKRNLKVMNIMAVWFLAIGWINFFWLIAPVMPNSHGFLSISWVHFGTFFFVAGVFLLTFWRKLISRALIPIGDPRLSKSINFINQ